MWGQCLPSKKRLSAPAPENYSQMFNLEFKCVLSAATSVWVLVSTITESGHVLSVSGFHQEQALSWRHSRCLKTDKSENHHRVPGYVV